MTANTEPSFRRIPHRGLLLRSLFQKTYRWCPKILRLPVEHALYRFDKNRFGFSIAMGNNCFAATLLRNAELRKFSGPFDWLEHLTLFQRLDLMADGFRNLLRREDLEYTDQRIPVENTIRVYNKRMGFCFVHDFTDRSDENYEFVKEKYRRRQNRFYRLAPKNNIVFLYVENIDDKCRAGGYKSEINLILNKLENLRTQLEAESITLVLCARSEKDRDYVDLYRQGRCAVFLQEFDPSPLEGGWKPYTKVNVLVNSALSAATNTEVPTD